MDFKFDELKEVLKLNDVEYREGVRLSELSSVRIGGRLSLLVYPESGDELILTLRYLRKSKIKHKTVGRMSNILPSDGGYDGVILKTDRMNSFLVQGSAVSLGAGASLPGCAAGFADIGLSGFEELSGIPGSVGGSVLGNAGAFGREISDILTSVTLYDSDENKVLVLPRDYIDFGYRHSGIDCGRFTIISASFSLKEKSPAEVKERIRAYRQRRRETQPSGLPSLGSTFKRPIGGYAAKMIDECGLRGFRVGGAEISKKHAGFIVNAGGATSNDFKALMSIAADRVWQRFGIMLEPEIEFLV